MKKIIKKQAKKSVPKKNISKKRTTPVAKPVKKQKPKKSKPQKKIVNKKSKPSVKTKTKTKTLSRSKKSSSVKKLTSTVDILMGSGIRVKLLRLVLGNPQRLFSYNELIRKTGADKTTLDNELAMLVKIGCIKMRPTYDTTEVKGKLVKTKTRGVIMDASFAYAESLYAFVGEAVTMERNEIQKKLAPAGKADLIVLSGFFMGDKDRMVDLLVVGNEVDRSSAEKIIGEIESELATDIRFVILSTDEFLYRLKMYDKLIRDILDFPHEKLLIRINHPDMV